MTLRAGFFFSALGFARGGFNTEGTGVSQQFTEKIEFGFQISKPFPAPSVRPLLSSVWG
jgi:hypothetical protein